MLIYMAHPVGGDVDANLAKAKVWLKWFMDNFPTVFVIAPWISIIEACGGDDNKRYWLQGMLCDREAAKRCDGVVYVGDFVSFGMRMEGDAARDEGMPVLDATRQGLEHGPYSSSVHSIKDPEEKYMAAVQDRFEHWIDDLRQERQP